MLMVCIEIMGSDVSVQMGGFGGELRVETPSRPIIIANYLHSALIMADIVRSFPRVFLIEGREDPRIATHEQTSIVR